MGCEDALPHYAVSTGHLPGQGNCYDRDRSEVDTGTDHLVNGGSNPLHSNKEDIMRDRAFRRDKDQKAKKRARFKFKIWNTPQLMTGRFIGIHARSPKVCSCYMCGNPRKIYGQKTVQERRAEQEREFRKQWDDENKVRDFS